MHSFFYEEEKSTQLKVYIYFTSFSLGNILRNLLKIYLEQLLIVVKYSEIIQEIIYQNKTPDWVLELSISG